MSTEKRDDRLQEELGKAIEKEDPVPEEVKRKAEEADPKRD